MQNTAVKRDILKFVPQAPGHPISFGAAVNIVAVVNDKKIITKTGKITGRSHAIGIGAKYLYDVQCESGTAVNVAQDEVEVA